MALQFSRVLQTANACEDICNQTASLLTLLSQFLEYNSDQAIDWGAGSKPAYIDEEANGNILGKAYSRQDVSNVIGSLDWVRKLLTNQTMTGSQGDHIGNLNHLTRPLG